EYAWFPNDGASLSAPVVLGSVATGPGVNPRLVAGDVDGDGDADAVVLRNAASGHQLSLFRSEGPVSAGAGSIGPETLLVPDAGGPEAIALAPIAAPGALDLVLSSRSLGVRVAPATGAGGYGPLVPMGTPSGATLGTWAVGDDDGDRLADVLVATQNMFNGSRQNALRLHRNASVGGVPALEAGVAAVPPTSTDSRAVVGDVTSDGFVDVVLPDRFVGTVRVFRGDAEGSVRTWVEVPTGLDRTQRIRIANVDGNESVDIVALDTDSSTLAWVAHRRVDASWTPHAIGSAGVDALDFVLFDDDLDGDLDVLVLTTPSSIRHEVVLFEQLSPGLFAAPRTVYGFTSIAYPRTFDAHDLDADGRPELLLGVSNGVFEGLRALGRTPAGDYALTDRFGVMGPAHAPDTCSHISVGDLDGDGDPDVVPTRWNGDHRLTWYENIDGTLFEARPLLFGGVPSPLACIRSTAVLDADGDGDLDIAASGSGLGSALLLYENRGGGSFAPAFPSTERRSVGVDLTVVDIDGDGRDDCVGPWFSRRGVTLFRARATNDFGGSAFCGPVLSNSTGRFGRMGMSGSDVASEGRSTLHAWDLPQQSFGLFATSRTLASVGVVPGSVGRLCLGGTIGRFVAPGQIQGSGWSGSFTLEIDPGALPQGGTAAPAVAGESWYFQAWHRDVVGGAQTSNFTEGLEVVWR
ncbi:MAG: FG-GAP-like repeat-containing protein, partial [Planctomycetota bacterium]